jgi:Flp pilus assembly protein TadD
MKVTLLHFGVLMLLALPITPLAAQDADESALDALDNAPKPPPVKVEPAGAVEFRDAMRRIAQRPNDPYALTDAGYAAIKLGDYDAAFNFFSRANTASPSDARIKTGLAIAQVRRENPFEALSLFDEASRLGASERSFAVDRALAFDLLGNFDRAERDYVLAGSMGANDELVLRHAISLALSGRRDDADRLLIPLLQKENPEAWRARAMMLAARGDYKEANKIALGFLSESEARRMDGYFRNMPRLTMAQQAAAMHFGHFPLGSDIGEDSNSVRTMAAATGAKPVPVSGDGRLVPSGQPLGTKTAVTKTDKPKKPSKKDRLAASTNAAAASAATKAAIDAAAAPKAVPGVLPPPSGYGAVRPPVRIALPALAKPQPVPVVSPPTPVTLPPSSAAATTAVPVAVKALPSVEPIVTAPDPISVPAVSVPFPVPVGPAPAPAARVEEVRVAKADAPVVLPSAALPPTQASQNPVESRVYGPVSETRVETASVIQPAANAEPIGPGFESVDAPIVTAVEPKPTIEPSSTLPLPTAATELPSQPALQAAVQSTAIADVPPAAASAAEKSFDLGALVESIEVPEEERKPSVAPVDLKKIKPATAKDEAASIKTDATGKQTAVTPRIWVQIATGADAKALGFDYGRLAKKNTALFAKQSGWTAIWGKTKRLLVGPFSDMKSAKKWEADFRKAGGQGMVWQSDKTAEITKLK